MWPKAGRDKEVAEALLEKVQGRPDERRQDAAIHFAGSTHCPALLAFDVLRPPRRRSATYVLAIALHLAVVIIAGVRIHRAVHLVTASAAVRSMTLALPAAPVAPVEEKIAPKPSPQQDRQQGHANPETTERKLKVQSIGAPPAIDIAMPFPSMITSQSTQAMLSEPLGRPAVSLRKGKSSTTHESSEAAAPPSTSAPEGALAGAKATWEGEVLARLGKFRRYPQSSRLRHEEGTVYLKFALSREGRILASAIEHSSGSVSLDKEALATLYRAQPLPAIPPHMPNELELSLPIEFFLQ
jgi:protein TonB